MIPGRTIFYIETTHGLPLQIMVDLCREQNMQFNAVAYCKAAIEAKWSLDKIRSRLGKGSDYYIALALGTVTPELTEDQKDLLWER
jgi:alanyl-tRNA synthetase